LVEGPKHTWTNGSVGWQASILLKFAHCSISRCAEHAINSAGIKTHVVQALLHRGDVVSGNQMPKSVTEHAVAKVPTCLLKATVGFWPDYAVDSQRPRLLKTSNRLVEGIVELRRVGITPSGSFDETEARQTIAYFNYGRATISTPIKNGHEVGLQVVG
jgi:hypothetical protein